MDVRTMKKKISNQPSQKKRLKWWIRNNYTFLIITGTVCLIVTLVLIFEISRYERTRNMEALLQKSRKDMRWGGITDNDVEILKKQYPNINWNNSFDRERWQNANKYSRKALRESMARQKLHRDKQ
jgi:hypothetical protein